jgi:hypothetical protein
VVSRVAVKGSAEIGGAPTMVSLVGTAAQAVDPEYSSPAAATTATAVIDTGVRR